MAAWFLARPAPVDGRRHNSPIAQCVERIGEAVGQEVSVAGADQMKGNVLLIFADAPAVTLQLDEATRSAQMEKLKVRPARLDAHAGEASRRGLGAMLARRNMCVAPGRQTASLEDVGDQDVKVKLFCGRWGLAALSARFE